MQKIQFLLYLCVRNDRLKGTKIDFLTKTFSMYLFFDAVSTQGYLGLYNAQKQEIAARYFAVAGNEGKELPAMIDSFLQEQSLSYNDIQNIVCVIGP